VDALLKQISKRLENHKFCKVFQSDLDRVWPPHSNHIDKQMLAILAFAEANNLVAIIDDPGISVTFRRS
jgi:hypothetical protein